MLRMLITMVTVIVLITCMMMMMVMMMTMMMMMMTTIMMLMIVDFRYLLCLAPSCSQAVLVLAAAAAGLGHAVLHLSFKSLWPCSRFELDSRPKLSFCASRATEHPVDPSGPLAGKRAELAPFGSGCGRF